MRATLLHRSDRSENRRTEPIRSTHGRPGRPAMVLGAVVLVLAACAAPSADTATSPPPTEADGSTPAAAPATVAPAPPPDAPAAPGTVIAAEAIEAPPGARASRLTYHSTSATGADIAVTGILLVPDGPAPSGGFPLVTWAHPTTGAADGCEPSRLGLSALPFPDQAIERGWAMVATDYEGLGSAGAHPYLVGASEGHAVLDAARAAMAVPASGVDAASPVVIWGFSQGGHAAAFAAQLAPTYAPELDLLGVAIAAPVSDVAGFTRRAEGMEDQLGVVLTTVNGFRAAYPELDPATVLTPEGVAALDEVERRCIGEINEAETRPIAEIIAASPSADPAFGARFAENRAGDAPVTVPVLVVQGSDDDIVDPAATAALVARWCAQGATVQAIVRPGVKHGVLDAEPFVGWIADRFAATEAPSTC